MSCVRMMMVGGLLGLFASPVSATKPELPSIGVLKAKLDAKSGQITLTPSVDASDVVVEIYGIDGLKVGTDDLVWMRFPSVKQGQPKT